MEKDYLILKRASASRPSGEWKDDDYDVVADGDVVGRIFKANAAPHSITSSARASSLSGMVRPSALAVFMLMISLSLNWKHKTSAPKTLAWASRS